MKPITKPQRKAIFLKFQRNADGAKTYREFRRRWYFSTMQGCVMGKWCGMWVGIEKDGYTHT